MRQKETLVNKNGCIIGPKVWKAIQINPIQKPRNGYLTTRTYKRKWKERTINLKQRTFCMGPECLLTWNQFLSQWFMQGVIAQVCHTAMTHKRGSQWISIQVTSWSVMDASPYVSMQECSFFVAFGKNPVWRGFVHSIPDVTIPFQQVEINFPCVQRCHRINT